MTLCSEERPAARWSGPGQPCGGQHFFFFNHPELPELEVFRYLLGIWALKFFVRWPDGTSGGLGLD